MLHQLNPPLPLETPRGRGLAHMVIDYGVEADLMWVVFLDCDGSCWTVANPEIRIQKNWTIGRRPADAPIGDVARPFAVSNGKPS